MSVTDTIIRFTTSTKPNITVKENIINNSSTSLSLYGKSTLNMSKIVNTNLIHILENFYNLDEPRKPIEGQIWCDTSDMSTKNEFGRLKINIKDSTGGIHFHDIAGTVMNNLGDLRHTGQIEAASEYNSIDQAHKDVYPEDATYKKYLTTKKHCDENYLKGWYSANNLEFNDCYNRKIKTPNVITFTSPGLFDDDQFKIINKKYLSSQFLSGENYVDHFIIPSATKKLYYSKDCLIDLPYQLITKLYATTKDKDARDILDNLLTNSTDNLEDLVVAAEADAEAAKIAADEAWTALGTISSQTAPAAFTFTGTGGTITGSLTMMDVSIPTVNAYTGNDIHPTITGLLTTEATLASTATYTITIDGTAIPTANITVTPKPGTGVEWSIDTTSLNWVADSTHDVIVTRIEDATHSYVSTTHDQIHIISLIVPTVDAKTISSALPTCTITGTIGTSAFATLPSVDSIKVVFNGIAYNRYNDTNANDSPELTVGVTGVWTLANVPTPAQGKWDVVVTRNANTKQVDSTTDEILVVPSKDSSLPTVASQTIKVSTVTATNITVTGTVGSKNLTDSNSTIQVTVTNSAGAVITGTLQSTMTDINWTYTITSLDSDAIYNVEAKRTDEYGSMFVDNTSNEIVIQKILDATLPTVDVKTVSNGPTVAATGTVGSKSLADSNSTFDIVFKDSLAPYVEETGVLTYDATGINWTYTLSNITGDKVYDITATRTDSYNNTYVDNTKNEFTVDNISHIYTGEFTTTINQLGKVNSSYQPDTNGTYMISITTDDTTAGTDIKSKSYSYSFSSYPQSNGTMGPSTVAASANTTTFYTNRDNVVITGVASLVITFMDDTTQTVTSNISYPPPAVTLDPTVDGYYIGDFNGYKLYYAPAATSDFRTMAYVPPGNVATSTTDGYTNSKNLSERKVIGYMTPGSAYPAASFCVGLTLGNHEWYLPSLKELQFIWANRSKLPSGQGMGSYTYSTSTYNGGDYFWILYNGMFLNSSVRLGQNIKARAVRRVPI